MFSASKSLNRGAEAVEERNAVAYGGKEEQETPQHILLFSLSPAIGKTFVPLFDTWAGGCIH